MPLTGRFLFFFFERGGVIVYLYFYDGPVMEFNICVASHWQSSTYAISEQKARNNLIYQFKKKNNKLPNTKITLPGKLTLLR